MTLLIATCMPPVGYLVGVLLYPCLWYVHIHWRFVRRREFFNNVKMPCYSLRSVRVGTKIGFAYDALRPRGRTPAPLY